MGGIGAISSQINSSTNTITTNDDANKDEILAAFEVGFVVIVNPTSSSEPLPEEGVITCYSGQANDFAISVYESDGVTPKDLTGLTMYLVVEEDGSATDKAIVENLVPTGPNNNQVHGELPTFSPSNTVRPCLSWALRVTGTHKRLGSGKVVWKPIPKKD
jgi:hypothetical protein